MILGMLLAFCAECNRITKNTWKGIEKEDRQKRERLFFFSMDSLVRQAQDKKSSAVNIGYIRYLGPKRFSSL